MRRALLLAAALLAGAPAAAEPASTRFAAIAFHDVVDRREDRESDAVTTQSLVDLFDWLKAEGWTPVSMAAIAAAGRGGPPLPEKAILLSFDDGRASFHDRVYPLLLAYNYPAVLAVVGSWLDVPAGGTVDYGGTPLPRDRFVSWDQLRRMQASGLVEIASHSHDLHRVVTTTPQGNSGPAARSWALDPATGRYEDDAAHAARVKADLQQARARILAETGRAPTVLVWPFGRFSGPASQAARDAGFTHAFTLEPRAADARAPMQLHRYYPMGDPSLGIIAWNLRFEAPAAETARLACLDIAPLAAATPADQDARLGALIEAVRTLGPTAVAIDVAPDAASAFTPLAGRPVPADIFGRVARQLGTRAGVEVLGRIRIPATAGAEGAPALAAAAARAAPIDGLLVEGADATTLEAIRKAATSIDPRLRLVAVGPADGADRQLLDAARYPSAATPAPGAPPAWRLLRLDQAPPADQARQLARAQAAGLTGFGLCPADPAAAALLAPTFSSATFPWKP